MTAPTRPPDAAGGTNAAGAADATCASCGATLTAATTYLTEAGPVCGSCFGQVQNRLDQAHRHAASRQTSLGLRAKRLGVAHGVMWSAAVILATQWAPLATWLSSVLLIAVAGLTLGLIMRRRLAYLVALGLDAAGAVALVAWCVFSLSFIRAWPLVLAAGFPLSLIALARAARAAYVEPERLGFEIAPLVKRWQVVAIAVGVLASAGAYLLLRPRRDPALELMATALPAWQTARARPGGVAGGPAAREMVALAKRWPAVGAALSTLDGAWPDEAAVRAAAKSVNQALSDAGLPYFADVQMVGPRPIVLSYQLAARVPWRIGARTVDVLRLRRVDTLNVELAFFGLTEAGLPVVLLDRVEATLAEELPAMYGKGPESRSSRFNEFDRLALGHLRRFFEARLGPSVATTAAAIGERDGLLEEMRSRLHDGRVQLNTPDGFVLGEAWLAGLAPQTRLSNPGGPLVLDTDLKDVAHADQKLRDDATTRLLGAVVDFMAVATEAHEARHAVDQVDPVGPPPSPLLDVMQESSATMIEQADKEVRAYLGELHDSALPACVTLAQILRHLYGRHVRRTPHFFAVVTIIGQLDPESDLEPAARLSALCAVPDADLRKRIAAVWQKLYNAPLPSGTRVGSP